MRGTEETNAGRPIAGRSILIVGGSGGLGGALAKRLGDVGANLTLAGRRRAPLEDIAAASSGESLVLSCDATSPADCQGAVSAAVERFGRLDVLLYAAGSSPQPSALDTVAYETWADVFGTNTFGAAMMIAAAAPHLRRVDGQVVLFSSDGAHDLKHGLTPYAAAKRALETIVEGWRAEEPRIAFTTLIIGAFGPTEFTAQWEPAVIDDYLARWRARGQMAQLGSVDALAAGVLQVLRAPIAVPVIEIQPYPSRFALD